MSEKVTLYFSDISGSKEVSISILIICWSSSKLNLNELLSNIPKFDVYNDLTLVIVNQQKYLSFLPLASHCNCISQKKRGFVCVFSNFCVRLIKRKPWKLVEIKTQDFLLDEWTSFSFAAI